MGASAVDQPVTEAAHSLVRVCDVFRGIDEEMPIQTVKTFLLVAANPGIGIVDIQKHLDVSSATASRNVARLGQVKGKGQAGHGLVQAAENPMDRRFKRVRLTERGEALLNRLHTAMGPEWSPSLSS